MTWSDHAQFRLSVFTREEARAIVSYLRYRRHIDTHGIHTAAIDAALDAFWLQRARHAPSWESLEAHVREEDAYIAAISGSGTPVP